MFALDLTAKTTPKTVCPALGNKLESTKTKTEHELRRRTIILVHRSKRKTTTLLVSYHVVYTAVTKKRSTRVDSTRSVCDKTDTYKLLGTVGCIHYRNDQVPPNFDSIAKESLPKIYSSCDLFARVFTKGVLNLGCAQETHARLEFSVGLQHTVGLRRALSGISHKTPTNVGAAHGYCFSGHLNQLTRRIVWLQYRGYGMETYNTHTQCPPSPCKYSCQGFRTVST